MENIVQTFDSNINTILQDYVKKPTIIRGIVHLLLMLYVVRLAPQPPKPVLELFENVYFKLFIFSLVLWTAQFSPSTSLLIALAFLVTMNYVNTGKVWEFLENVQEAPAAPAEAPVVVVTPEQAVEAVKVLADAAAAPAAVAPEVVAPVAEIAASAVKTEEGAAAISALAQQAVISEAGEPAKVAIAAQVAVDSMQAVPAAPAPAAEAVPEVSAKQAVAAVQALAEAAASPEPAAAEDVIPVANIAAQAAAQAGDAQGVAAVKALAEQAMEPAAGKPEQVKAAAEAAVAAVVGEAAPAPAPAEQAAGAPTPAAQASGCYPLRKFDMSLVKPQVSGRYTYEDYQAFTSTPQ